MQPTDVLLFTTSSRHTGIALCLLPCHSHLTDHNFPSSFSTLQVQEKSRLGKGTSTPGKETNTLVKEKSTLVKEKSTLGKETNTLVTEKNTLVKEKNMKEKNTLAKEKNMKEKNTLVKEKSTLEKEKNTLVKETSMKEKSTRVMVTSRLVMGKSRLEMEKSKPEMVMNTQAMGSCKMETDNSLLELGHTLVNNWAVAPQWRPGPSSCPSTEDDSLLPETHSRPQPETTETRPYLPSSCAN
jgi:cell division protein FtsL